MALKNKEIDKLFDAVELYFDSYCLPSLITAFMACDDTIEGEIAAIKAELTEAKQRLNNERKHGEDLADVNGQLASENGNLKARLTLFEHSRITWRARAQHAEKEVEDLNKKISELEEENETLRSKLEKVDKEYSILRTHNEGLNTANSALRRRHEMLYSKIEELEAEKARLKEAYDIHESTIERLKLLLAQRDEIEALKKENSELRTLREDLSNDHEFEFGDKVLVPWSDAPYMYIKTSLMYNPRSKSLVYVGKTQYLKWLGEKFEIK